MQTWREECEMISTEELAGVTHIAVSLPIGFTRPAAVEDDPMDQVGREFGDPNPNAPAALSRFAFLIGRWRCDAKLKSTHGEWQNFEATWFGRFILDGHAIADEYRMTGPSGDLIVLGMNFRSYDNAKRTWNVKWLDALAGTWTDLVTEELGGVMLDDQSVIYAFREPMDIHPYTRATYTNISQAHFTWRGEKSDDRKAWSEFMVVEAYRSDK